MTNTAADLSTRGLGFVDMANRWLGPGGRPSRCLVFATRCGTKAPICRVPDQASKDSSVMGTCCTCMAIEAFGCKFPWSPPPLSIVIAPHVSCLLHRLLHRQTESCSEIFDVEADASSAYSRCVHACAHRLRIFLLPPIQLLASFSVTKAGGCDAEIIIQGCSATIESL